MSKINYDDYDLTPLKPQVSHDDYNALEHDANALAAEPYGGLTAVYVGTIIARREVYKEPPTLYATIHYPDPTTGGFTPKQIEGYPKCSSVIDRETLDILEVRTY